MLHQLKWNWFFVTNIFHRIDGLEGRQNKNCSEWDTRDRRTKKATSSNASIIRILWYVSHSVFWFLSHKNCASSCCVVVANVIAKSLSTVCQSKHNWIAYVCWTWFLAANREPNKILIIGSGRIATKPNKKTSITGINIISWRFQSRWEPKYYKLFIDELLIWSYFKAITLPSIDSFNWQQYYSTRNVTAIPESVTFWTASTDAHVPAFIFLTTISKCSQLSFEVDLSFSTKFLSVSKSQWIIHSPIRFECQFWMNMKTLRVAMESSDSNAFVLSQVSNFTFIFLRYWWIEPNKKAFVPWNYWTGQFIGRYPSFISATQTTKIQSNY